MAIVAAALVVRGFEVRATLAQFRDRVTAVLDNPDNVATEVRTFLA
jgi:hypothetical protein